MKVLLLTVGSQGDVLPFVAAQAVGGALGFALVRYLFPASVADAMPVEEAR